MEGGVFEMRNGRRWQTLGTAIATFVLFALAVVDWVRLCAKEGYPEAGTRVAGTWPSHADADHSWLLNRLLQGVPPLPEGDPRAKGLWHNGLSGGEGECGRADGDGGAAR
jgi:hypothetical protein